MKAISVRYSLACFIILANLFSFNASADINNDQDMFFQNTASAIQEHYTTGDIEGLSKTIKLLSKEAKSAKIMALSSRYVPYYTALANYRAGIVDHKNAQRHLQSCISHTNKLIDKDKEFVEAYILYAACSNTLIGNLPEQARELSSNARNAIQKASDLESSNPRLLFIQATSAVYTPSQFGGGIEQASKFLASAIEQFEKRSATKQNKILPNWGLDEVYMWTGMLLSVQGKQVEAIAALEKSLEIDDNKWIKQTLLPTLKKGDSIGRFFGL